jgi:hypothetical protein
VRQHATKGRVERANKTLQDRLVKELRPQGISTIAAGNQLLAGFLADYNARFGKEPRNSKNLHRPLSADDDLADVFAWREERTVRPLTQRSGLTPHDAVSAEPPAQ